MLKEMIASITRIDTFLLYQVFSWNGRKLVDRVVYWVSRSGDGYLYALIGLLLLIFEPAYGRFIVLSALIAFGIELPAYMIIKRSMKRVRPCDELDGIDLLIIPPDKFSFPSGHTAAVFLMATILGDAYPLVRIPMLLWAFFVGFSRVYLGVHYPTDVLAGIVLGVMSARIGLLIF